MPRNGSRRPLTGILRAEPTWQFRLVVGIVGLTAAISALRIAFNLGYNYGLFKAVDGVHTTCCVNFLESFLLPITTGLVLSTAGIYVQRPIGFLLSLIALLAIPFTYVAWYLGTLSIMRHAEVGSFSQLPSQQQHVLTLADASWWDIWVLSIAILLILWQSEKLFRSLRTADWEKKTAKDSTMTRR